MLNILNIILTILFKQKEINIIKVPDAITINFVPFDIVKTTNSCYMLDDDGHAL